MRKIISIVLSFGLLFQQGGLVYAAGQLNLANYLSSMHSAITQPDRFQPARLRYISYDIANNDFKLLLDKGNAKLNDATPELFNYFLIGLALPNDTFWVNLRPDAADNIIDPLLEKTDIGKIFLEADLQLKKDTAGLTSPQNPEGKAYWDKLYKKAGELFGTENITIPTITRPWIVPNEVIVRETEDSAYIYKATLKVMLEADYLIGRGGSRTAPTPDQYSFSDPRLKELNEYSSQIIRETIIPKLTKEVNSSKRYAKLRQVYYSLVLSRWFKQKYSSLGSTRAPEHQSSGARGDNYVNLINSGNLVNLTSQEPCDKQTYFQAYQKSFKDGEYNLKETVATPFGQSIRSYVSGGISVGSPIKSGNVNIGVANMKVTKALAGQLPPAIVGSPIEMTRLTNAFKKIQSGLKDIYVIVSFLSQPRNGYNSKIQGVSNPLGQVISSLQKKINYLGQIRKEKISIEYILSDFGKLKDDLGKIQSAINKFVEENSLENKNGSIRNNFNDLSIGIKKVLIQVEELDKELQTSAGSPLTLKKANKRADDILFKIVRVEAGAASLLQKEDSNVRKAFEKSNILDKIGEYYNPNTGEVDDFRVLSEALESVRGSIDSFLRDKRVNGIKEKTAYIMMNKAGKDLGGLIKDIDDEILRRLLLPPEFITARDGISLELQNVINSLEDSINPIKVKAEYRSRYFSFVTEAMAEIGDIQKGFEENKDFFTGYNALLDIIDKKVVPVIDNLYSKVKVKLVNVRGVLDSARNHSDELVAAGYSGYGSFEYAGYRWLDGVLKDIERRVSEFNKRFTLMRNKLSELSGHKEISVGSPVLGEPLLGKDGEKIGVYVSLGDLRSVQKNELLYLVKGKVFPALTIKESEILGIGENGREILDELVGTGILKEIPSTEGFLKVNKSLYIGNVRNIIKNDKDFPEVWRILKYSISGAKAMPVVEMSHLNKMRFAVKVSENGKLILLGLLQFDKNNKVEDVMGGSIEIISALSKARKKEVGVSSAVVSRQVPQKTGQWGGIDLTDRALHIKLERVGSFASTPLLLPQVKNAESLDLDKEFEQVEALASSGIVPNSRRLLELFTACHYRGEFGQRLTQIISCLKASSAIQEAEAIDSDEDFRLALMMPEVLS